MNKFMAMAIVLLAVIGTSFGQDTLELRGASTQYRFADWTHNFHNKLATDLYYVGVPGNNEYNACGGFQFQRKSLSLTPFICGVAAKEDHEVGIKYAAAVTFQKHGFNADANLAHFTPLRGSVSAYDLADAANLTHNIGKKWEAGLSTGFFRQEKSWNPLIGPVIRRNDGRGTWSLSFRGGSGWELRLGRTLTLRR